MAFLSTTVPKIPALSLSTSARKCSLLAPSTSRPSFRRTSVPRVVPRCNSSPQPDFTPPSPSVDPAKIAVGTFWSVYCYLLLFSDLVPGVPAQSSDGAVVLKQVIDLSLNFWYVLPLTFPAVAPVIDPTHEALFNLVVAWALLMYGFLSDYPGQKKGVSTGGFLVMVAFLTNIFYLPYLFLRESSPTAPPQPLSLPVKVAESKAWPAVLLTVALFSAYWMFFGRASAEYPVDFHLRVSRLWEMITSDRLVLSLAVDTGVFWLFQGWLVPDDMKRRNWVEPSAPVIARTVPFFGLVYYLWKRPKLVE